MEHTTGFMMDSLTTYGLNVIGALIILFLGKIAAGFGRKIVERLLQKSKTDATVSSFAGNLVYVAILVFAVIAALAKFGVQTTSFIAVIGAAGLAVGLALQGSLANFAAGVMLLVFRPFKAGDFIDAAGVGGTVKEIQLFTTTLSTPDNVKVIMPNGKVFGDTIRNFSANDTRRLDMVVGIGYGSSMEKAIEIMRGLLAKDPRVLPEPEPLIAVAELADSSVNFFVRPWVNRADYWAVKFDFTRAVKEAFDENGIEIPFPQRMVHMAGKSS